MLVSGVLAGVVIGVAFGGDWRRLAMFTLRWWPLLVVASVLRAYTVLDPNTSLAIYLLGLSGIGLVAAANYRLPGAALIAVGTFSNVLVIALNGGMPYDPAVVLSAGAPPPNDSLHVLLRGDTALAFLSDIIPFGLISRVYSIGDFILAFGGFLIPFMWLQPEADATRHDVRSANFA